MNHVCVCQLCWVCSYMFFREEFDVWITETALIGPGSSQIKYEFRWGQQHCQITSWPGDQLLEDCHSWRHVVLVVKSFYVSLERASGQWNPHGGFVWKWCDPKPIGWTVYYHDLPCINWFWGCLVCPAHPNFQTTIGCFTCSPWPRVAVFEAKSLPCNSHHDRPQVQIYSKSRCHSTPPWNNAPEAVRYGGHKTTTRASGRWNLSCEGGDFDRDVKNQHRPNINSTYASKRSSWDKRSGKTHQIMRQKLHRYPQKMFTWFASSLIQLQHSLNIGQYWRNM